MPWIDIENDSDKADEELVCEMNRVISERRILFDTDPRFIEHIEVKRKTTNWPLKPRAY